MNKKWIGKFDGKIKWDRIETCILGEKPPRRDDDKDNDNVIFCLF